MYKKEKVIEGLLCCVNNERATPDCMRCPYAEINGTCNGLHKLHRDALALLKTLSGFKAYFDDLYGHGLEVANWHKNGETEPFDSFYESALEAEK